MTEYERLCLITKLEHEHFDMLNQMVMAGYIICVYPEYWKDEN